eukprot:1743446-Rhodomonas_salina.1
MPVTVVTFPQSRCRSPRRVRRPLNLGRGAAHVRGSEGLDAVHDDLDAELLLHRLRPPHPLSRQQAHARPPTHASSRHADARTNTHTP